MSQFQSPKQPPMNETQPTPIIPNPHKKRMRFNKKKDFLVIVSLLGIFALLVFVGVISSGALHPTASATPTVDLPATATASDDLTATANAIFEETASAQITPVPTTPVPLPTPQSDIGLTQQSGPWSVTVNDVTTSQGDQAFTPKTGYTYLIIGVTLKNTSNTTQVANEAVLFALRDDQGNQYTATALLNDQVIFGAVVASQQLRGHLVYEVPKSVKSFVLQCQNDFDPSTVVQWNLSV